MGDDFAIELDGVTKRYPGGVTAVADLRLRVPRGEVFGFLGPNGAGKTTTMRMLVGLVRPTSGRIRVLGQPPGTPEQLAQVGALIESPTFYPHLSGLDNLRLAARYAGVPESAAERVLAEVDLSARAGSRFREYSLGMKQRLGVAAALLKQPHLLILDEPTNGLDPAGVSEMRELLRSLGQRGHTVLLSSHVLGEVEQVCDRIAVIDGGRLVADGTPDELRARLGSGSLVIVADPVDKAVACLTDHAAVQRVDTVDDTLRVATDPALAAELNRLLVQAGVEVRELRPVRHSLEEAFLELTKAERTTGETGPTSPGEGDK
ncbi:ABC-2 type transport system ATP-binding protein [Micromonospora pallida]|uniref:ABC-2 type transport system ATP-binding protein n=1 Tax=Micromonospora pallida TaxID=145854 RepID=A0A1C6RQK2_9ACTN|nr:ABC transporter ATP-binding protein [Micromonospora pallida]SCL19434.1 ABC-2 type transport system ATP-binding protein [Micromonospora pallida]